MLLGTTYGNTHCNLLSNGSEKKLCKQDINTYEGKEWAEKEQGKRDKQDSTIQASLAPVVVGLARGIICSGEPVVQLYQSYHADNSK